MSDELLKYYNSELQYLRRQGDEFAQQHKELAGHLRLNAEGQADPYVGRLVQAFAYLNARTRMKLDDEFPEIAGSLLEIVLPHYQRPIPSTSVVQFVLDSAQSEQFSGHAVSAGSILESEAIEGEPCYFRTAYPVVCWPFHVAEVSLKGVPFEAPASNCLAKPPLGLLKIQLRTSNREIPFSAFQAQSLRFFINQEPPFSYQLYELIFNSLVGVAIASSPKDERAQFLPEKSVAQVGFGVEEGLFDFPAQSFLGYRLLSEYFSCRDKFLFFDLNFENALRAFDSPSLDLYFFLDRRWQNLEAHVERDTMVLGCTPITNLFEKRAEPIRLNHFNSEYRIVPDSRRPRAHEIYSIESVRGVSSSGKSQEFYPFYSVQHAGTSIPRAFWHCSRRELRSEDALARGTELDIAFVDADFNPLSAEQWTIDINTLCSNRNLPSRMPFGGGRPRLQLESSGVIGAVNCLKKPTAPCRPALGQGLRWRAVSHLSLNYLSLTDGAANPSGANALKELLALYDHGLDPTAANSIAGINHISTRPVVGRIPGNRSGGICRGILVTVDFDEDKYSSGNLFLFACVMERFLALYSNINSFTQVIATTNRRQGVMHRWPARAGLQEIL